MLLSLWPELQENHFHYLLGGLITALAFLWLRKELTPAKALSLFESEGVLSMRLVLAFAVVVFTLCMQAKGRLTTMMVEANYTLAGILLGLGVGKVVGKAFASRAPDTTVNAKKADVHGEKITVNGGAAPDEPQEQKLAGYDGPPGGVVYKPKEQTE